MSRPAVCKRLKAARPAACIMTEHCHTADPLHLSIGLVPSYATPLQTRQTAEVQCQPAPKPSEAALWENQMDRQWAETALAR